MAARQTGRSFAPRISYDLPGRGGAAGIRRSGKGISGGAGGA